MRTSWNRPVANRAFSDSSIWAGIVGVARGEGEIGADRLGLDALVALDADVLDDALGMRGQVAKTHAETQRERDATQHKEGREQPSGERPPHHSGVFPSKPIPAGRYG